MDANTYTDIWINLATNSPFLGWMIYTYLQTQKDLKQTREDSKTELRELRTEAREEESRIRDRFEAVIRDLQQDRQVLVDGFSGATLRVGTTEVEGISNRASGHPCTSGLPVLNQVLQRIVLTRL